MGSVFQDDVVLVELGVLGVDLALTEGVVEGVVDGLGGDAEAGGGGAVDDEGGGGPPSCWSVTTSESWGSFLSLATRSWDAGVELGLVGVFEGVLVLGAGDAVVHGEVLDGLHVELDAGDFLELGTEAVDDLRGGEDARSRGA